MNLDISQWKTFKIKKLFPILIVGSANQGMLSEGKNCFYVGAKRNDNGVILHCQRDEDLILKGNCIVFICNGEGSVGYANYMDRDFIGTTDIVAGYNKKLNYLNGVFLATVISKERPKYSFGRKWKTHLKDTEIKLPVQYNKDSSILIDDTHEYSDEGYIPDWQFMEDYIKSLRYKPITTKNKTYSIDLNVQNWKFFKIKDLFDDFTGGDLIIREIEQGNIPIASNSAENNNIVAYSDVIPNRKLFDHEISISIADRGKFWAFIQPKDFYIGTRAKALVSKNAQITLSQLAFITTIINRESFKFCYGRNCCDNLPNILIKLPIQHSKEGDAIIDETHSFSDEGYIPDWEFMENYIKSLPYGDCI